jgi:hypothetical protein
MTSDTPRNPSTAPESATEDNASTGSADGASEKGSARAGADADLTRASRDSDGVLLGPDDPEAGQGAAGA